MRPTQHFWADRPVAVTGGTGFLGYHLVQQLHALGARVRVLALPPAKRHPVYQFGGLEHFWGDVRDLSVVRPALAGCATVFHTAGTVATWGQAVVRMHSVHLDGTRTVLSALDRHSRLVHTSSLVVLGATRTGQLVDEAHPQPAPFAFAYAEAKRASEHLACAAACAGREVVITNPAYLLGPEDYERSVMGQLCERFWRGKIPVAPPGGWNVVDVRDVATGHLLAAERGQVGERYVLGGQNLRCIDVFQHLAQVAGFGRHTLPQLPQWLYRLIARGSELYGWLVGKEPYPNRTQAELNRYFWYCHSQKAQAELGYTPRPLTRTVADTFAWYRQRGLRLPRGWRRWWLRAA